MGVLYVDEYGCVVRGQGGRIVVEKDSVERVSVRVQELDAVIFCENCSLTSAALAELLEHEIHTAVLNRRGDYAGRLEAPPGKNVLLRRAQYRLADNPAFCLAMSKRFVASKLANMRTVLLRFARSQDDAAVRESAERIKEAALAAGAARSLEELLGYEGAGSREYFSAFRLIVRPPFVFEGRNRRPPRDPVNAALGFAYALLENVTDTGLAAAGLDPFCGFYHRDVYGRSGLALDLMEEFRPVIADSVVLNCCNRGILHPEEHFEARDGGVYLNEAGRQKFFAAFYARLKEKTAEQPGAEPVEYRTIVFNQARMIASCVKRGVPDYKPFRIR